MLLDPNFSAFANLCISLFVIIITMDANSVGARGRVGPRHSDEPFLDCFKLTATDTRGSSQRGPIDCVASWPIVLFRLDNNQEWIIGGGSRVQFCKVHFNWSPDLWI